MQETRAISMFGAEAIDGCEQTTVTTVVFDHTQQKKSIRLCGKLTYHSCRQIQKSWKWQHRFSFDVRH